METMKQLRHFFLMMFTVALCCGFVACGDDDDEPEMPGGEDVDIPVTVVPGAGNTPDNLIGVWDYSDVDEDGEEFSMGFTFKSNGVCTLMYDGEFVGLGNCNASGSSLSLDFGTQTYSGSYSVSGNKLRYKMTIRDIDDNEPPYTVEVEFTKVSSNVGYEPAKVTGNILGTWQWDNGNHSFTFLANGLVKYVQKPVDGLDHIEVYSYYGVDGNSLTFHEFDNGMPSFLGGNAKFAIDGNTLTMTFVQVGVQQSVVAKRV